MKKKYIESNIVQCSNRQNILAHTIIQNNSKNMANFSGIDCCSSSKSSLFTWSVLIDSLFNNHYFIILQYIYFVCLHSTVADVIRKRIEFFIFTRHRFRMTVNNSVPQSLRTVITSGTPNIAYINVTIRPDVVSGAISP
jgi:hypothetical protein